MVWNGLVGRMLIAIEPALCSAVFLALALGMVLRAIAHHAAPAAAVKTSAGMMVFEPGLDGAVVLAPIFGFAALAFTVYAILMIVPPVRAYLQTFKPIYVVDGYVRLRGPDAASDPLSTGYVAVLTEDGRVAAEWPVRGDQPLEPSVQPALIEFSDYGGIHRIDGRPTGVLPERISRFGVGPPRG